MRDKTILPVLLAAAMLTGCGNYVNASWNGLTGVSHDGSGNLSIHVNTCENSTQHVDVMAGREELVGNQENPTIGSFSAPEPVSGSVVIDISDPAPWSVDQELVLPEDPTHFFIVYAHPADTGGSGLVRAEKYFSTAEVTWEQLMSVAPGTIATGYCDGELDTRTPEEFAAACAEHGQ